jgi:hydroxyethylthiazole kinase-like sugar kinase family protein
MAEAEEEQADLARVPGGLLINFGTLDALDGILAAGRYANQNGKPVVFDPVGVGATTYRRVTATSECLRVAVWYLALMTVPPRTTGRMAADSDQG